MTKLVLREVPSGAVGQPFAAEPVDEGARQQQRQHQVQADGELLDRYRGHIN